jgi:hypothetical protein
MTHFYLLYSCAAVSREAGRGAGAAHGGDSGPGGDPIPTSGPLRSAAINLDSCHLSSAALLHGGAGPEAEGDGQVRGPTGQLWLPPRRESEGKFLTFCYYSTDGSNYNFISSGK